MLCDKCKKNEATIHVKKVSGGKIESLHLCAACAKENEEQGALGAFGFNLAEVLFNIGEINKQESSAEKAASENSGSSGEEGPCCPVCGWNMDNLRKFNGRVGCASCYETFSEIIADALTRIQRGKVHLGKRPGASDPLANTAALQIEIERNKKELAGFILREEYEKAAVCRDKIADLNACLALLKGTDDEQ